MKQKKILFYALIFISFMLAILLFQKIDNLQSQGSIIECLSGNQDLPLTTLTETCQNVCGPMARCSQTGDQCVLDSDCPMCPPPITTYNRVSERPVVSSEFTTGDNDSGKSVGMLPKKSQLTSNYPHDASIFSMQNPIEMGNILGVNVWSNKFINGMKYYRKRYEEPSAVYYAERYTLSGEFPDDGPFAANA